MGEKNGDLVRWYVTFAGTEVVIGYNPQSRFAADLERARLGEIPWYQVLQTPGLRIGRPDPELAPLGYRVLFAMSLAEGLYGVPGLRAQVLGPDQNEEQIFPAEELAARLEAGQLDVAFLYRATVVPIGLPYIAASSGGEPGPVVAGGAVRHAVVHEREEGRDVQRVAHRVYGHRAHERQASGSRRGLRAVPPG